MADSREPQIQRMIDFLAEHPDAVLVAGRELAVACRSVGVPVRKSAILDDDDPHLYAMRKPELLCPEPEFELLKMPEPLFIHMLSTWRRN